MQLVAWFVVVALLLVLTLQVYTLLVLRAIVQEAHAHYRRQDVRHEAHHDHLTRIHGLTESVHQTQKAGPAPGIRAR